MAPTVIPNLLSPAGNRHCRPLRSQIRHLPHPALASDLVNVVAIHSSTTSPNFPQISPPDGALPPPRCRPTPPLSATILSPEPYKKHPPAILSHFPSSPKLPSRSPSPQPNRAALACSIARIAVYSVASVHHHRHAVASPRHHFSALKPRRHHKPEPPPSPAARCRSSHRPRAAPLASSASPCLAAPQHPLLRPKNKAKSPFSPRS